LKRITATVPQRHRHSAATEGLRWLENYSYGATAAQTHSAAAEGLRWLEYYSYGATAAQTLGGSRRLALVRELQLRCDSGTDTRRRQKACVG